MILTNEEITDINQNAEFDSAIGYARKVESAVLDRIKKQEPFGYFSVNDYGDWEQTDAENGRPLYEYPSAEIALLKAEIKSEQDWASFYAQESHSKQATIEEYQLKLVQAQAKIVELLDRCRPEKSC